MPSESGSSTTASLQESSSTNSKRKRLPSVPSVQTTSSLQTVAQDSISRGKACYRFYNSRLKGVYNSCALPTETPYAASHTILSSTYYASTEQRSAWRHTTFHPPPSASWPMMSSLSSPFLALVSTVPGVKEGGAQSAKPRKRAKKTSKQKNNSETESESLVPVKVEDIETQEVDTSLIDKEEEEPIKQNFRVYRLRVLPTAVQKRAIKLAFAVSRAAYNFANDRVRNGKETPNAQNLRKEWIARKAAARASGTDDLKWIVQSGVHNKIDAQAIRQLAAAYASNDAKQKKGGLNEGYTVKFRSHKRTRIETLNLEKVATAGPLLCFRRVPFVARKKHAQCLVKLGGHFTATGGLLVEDKPSVIERMVSEARPLVDGKLTWDKRLGTFHFLYTFTLPTLPDPDPTFQEKRIAAADPGVYPFQAWYSPTSGEHGRLLDGETETLKKRCLALDKLRSRIDKYRGGRTRHRRQRWRTRSRLRRRFVRECLRLMGWVKGAHYDCAHQLLQKHDLIIQPVFETSRLVCVETRNIQSSTARAMLTWSHYKYHQRLKSAAVRYPGRHIIDAREPGTSKTCTGCGAWNASLRVQDKIFVCPTCGLRVDRQLAGARNNFLAAYGAAMGIGWDGVGG